MMMIMKTCFVVQKRLLLQSLRCAHDFFTGCGLYAFEGVVGEARAAAGKVNAMLIFVHVDICHVDILLFVSVSYNHAVIGGGFACVVAHVVPQVAVLQLVLPSELLPKKPKCLGPWPPCGSGLHAALLLVSYGMRCSDCCGT
jgi:hypothetical protein